MENEHRPEHLSDGCAHGPPRRWTVTQPDLAVGYRDGSENSETFHTLSPSGIGSTVPGPPGAQGVTHH